MQKSDKKCKNFETCHNFLSIKNKRGTCIQCLKVKCKNFETCSNILRRSHKSGLCIPCRIKNVIPYEGIENIDYIICQICLKDKEEKRFKHLSRHLKYFHSMTSKEYRFIFEDAVLSCNRKWGEKGRFKKRKCFLEYRIN